MSGITRCQRLLLNCVLPAMAAAIVGCGSGEDVATTPPEDGAPAAGASAPAESGAVTAEVSLPETDLLSEETLRLIADRAREADGPSILEGIPEDGPVDPQELLSLFEKTRAGFSAQSPSPEAIRNWVLLHFEVARMHEQFGDQEIAPVAMARAALAAVRAHAADPEAGAPSPVGILFPEYAARMAMDGRTDAAVELLTAAFRNGAMNPEYAMEHEAFGDIRSREDFAQLLDGWKSDSVVYMKVMIRQEIASFEPFPFDFSVESVDEQQIALEDYRGKVCIVDIWGTWCPPCREEVPHFIDLQSRYGEQGLQIVGLNYEQQSPEANLTLVTDFIRDNNMNYPCALITQDFLQKVPDFEGFPTTIFVDRKGTVRLKIVGGRPLEYLETVATLLLEEEA